MIGARQPVSVKDKTGLRSNVYQTVNGGLYALRCMYEYTLVNLLTARLLITLARIAQLVASSFNANCSN